MSSEEYRQRLKTPFVPPTHTLAQVRAAVPKHLYNKSTLKSLGYVFRDIVLAGIFGYAATHLDGVADSFHARSLQLLGYGTNLVYPVEVGKIATGDWESTRSPHSMIPPSQNLAMLTVRVVAEIVMWTLWATYWWFQSLTAAGMWCLGHEAGHGALSPYHYVNESIGFILHTFLLVPYHSWRATHHAHHKATASVERDENYVPSTRSSLKVPSGATAHISNYHDILEETPVYTIFRMMFMQLFGWHAYLCWNALGSPMYPRGTNHFNPSSKLFKPAQRFYIHLSNLGLLGMASLLYLGFRPYGIKSFVIYYFIPYLLSNHWIVMLTYLHHTDPSIPHYRKDEWSFLRGASATVDRPLLGWFGRFFLHNVSHDHVAHHHFPMIPFYNQPQVTQAIKSVLGHSYNYDSTNSFYALYRSFTECEFIEEDDAIAFYKNKAGLAQRSLACTVHGTDGLPVK